MNIKINTRVIPLAICIFLYAIVGLVIISSCTVVSKEMIIIKPGMPFFLALLSGLILPCIVAYLAIDKMWPQKENAVKPCLINNINDKLSLQSQCIYYQYSTNRGIIDCSDKLEEILMFSIDDHRNDPFLWNSSIHPDDFKIFNRALEDFYNGHDYRHEIRIKNKHGKWLWFCNQFIQTLTKDQETVIVGIVSDITSRKEIENCLVLSKEKYQKLFEFSAIPLMELDLSIAKQYLDDLMKKGISNIKEYLDANSQELAKLTSMLKFLDCNYKCLEYFETDSKEEFFINFIGMMDLDSFVLYKEQLNPSDNDKLQLISEISIKTKNGSNKILALHTSILKGNEPDCSRALVSLIDLTPLKETEEALKKSQELFHKAFLYNPNPMMFTSLIEGVYIDVNLQFLKSTGYSREEVVGKQADQLSLWSDSVQRDSIIAEIKKKGYVHNVEIEAINKFGETMNLIWSGDVIMMDNKPYLLGTTTDISLQKKTELALKKSEEKYRKLFDFSNDAIFILDQDGKVQDINKRASKLLQREKPDIINRLMVDLCPENEKAISEMNFKLVKEQGHLIFESKLIQSNGNIIDVEISTNIIWEKPINIQSMVRDISRRKKDEKSLKESENRFKHISSIISDIAYSCVTNENYNYRLNWVMGASESISGYSVEELIELGSWGKIVIDEDFVIFKENIMDLSPGGTSHCELRVLHKNGSIVWIESYAECHFSNELQNEYIIYGGLVEITERKQAQEELILLNHQLKEHNFAKDKLFSIISHDLKSPFSTILSYSSLLNKNLRKYDIERSEKFAGFINHSAKQTLNLLENLLSWAKTQTGQIVYKQEPIDLCAVINGIMETLNPVASIKKISINNHLKEPLFCMSDANMLKTILRNLLTNAIKYSQQGSEIDVVVVKMEQSIEIAVNDNGIGMDEQTIGNLFNLDGKTPRSGTENERGSGLGLLICKEFVEKLGGRIAAESVLGQGSRFLCTLPLT
jgi:PAS domain S-box-containing protein